MKVAIIVIILLLIVGRCSRDARKSATDASAPAYGTKCHDPLSKPASTQRTGKNAPLSAFARGE